MSFIITYFWHVITYFCTFHWTLPASLFLAIPVPFQQALKQQVRVNSLLPVNFLYDWTCGALRGQWRPHCGRRGPPAAGGCCRCWHAEACSEPLHAAGCSCWQPAAIAMTVRCSSGGGKTSCKESQTTETRCQRRYRETAPPTPQILLHADEILQSDGVLVSEWRLELKAFPCMKSTKCVSLPDSNFWNPQSWAQTLVQLK